MSGAASFTFPPTLIKIRLRLKVVFRSDFLDLRRPLPHRAAQGLSKTMSFDKNKSSVGAILNVSPAIFPLFWSVSGVSRLCRWFLTLHESFKTFVIIVECSKYYNMFSFLLLLPTLPKYLIFTIGKLYLIISVANKCFFLWSGRNQCYSTLVVYFFSPHCFKFAAERISFK